MELLDYAKGFLWRSIGYEFTKSEKQVLDLFFTNTDRPIFFMHMLPESAKCVVLAMYSRIKNPRGIRGIFVDAFFPHFLASTFDEVETYFDGKPEKYLANHRIDSLDKFLNHSTAHRFAFDAFIRSFQIDPKYIERFSNSPKVQQFIRVNLDGYGHNSIARTAEITLGIEGVSILAAKTMEWTRPGSGYIELSTRYVDMAGKDMFDLSWLFDVFQVGKLLLEDVIGQSFDYYRHFQGDNFSGPLPQFYRNEYASLVPNLKDLERGVIGETCDVLGNFLPCATLTSLGIAMSGEAFPQLLKHLILDDTPENQAILGMILEEGSKVGANIFTRHYLPSDWEKIWWQYLSLRAFPKAEEKLVDQAIITSQLIRRKVAEQILLQSTFDQLGDGGSYSFEDLVNYYSGLPRTDFDRLPYHFEKISAGFKGVMTFRSWRDAQRQQLATHARTYVTPLLGFYRYDKPAPKELNEAFAHIGRLNTRLYEVMCARSVPPELMQYPLAMGNMIGFNFASNLRELEFCAWQRSKFSVNHEVRQIFLGIERALRVKYSWWSKFSRADMTPGFVFARTAEGISL